MTKAAVIKQRNYKLIALREAAVVAEHFLKKKLEKIDHKKERAAKKLMEEEMGLQMLIYKMSATFGEYAVLTTRADVQRELKKGIRRSILGFDDVPEKRRLVMREERDSKKAISEIAAANNPFSDNKENEDIVKPVEEPMKIKTKRKKKRKNIMFHKKKRPTYQELYDSDIDYNLLNHQSFIALLDKFTFDEDRANKYESWMEIVFPSRSHNSATICGMKKRLEKREIQDNFWHNEDGKTADEAVITNTGKMFPEIFTKPPPKSYIERMESVDTDISRESYAKSGILSRSNSNAKTGMKLPSLKQQGIITNNDDSTRTDTNHDTKTKNYVTLPKLEQKGKAKKTVHIITPIQSRENTMLERESTNMSNVSDGSKTAKNVLDEYRDLVKRRASISMLKGSLLQLAKNEEKNLEDEEDLWTDPKFKKIWEDVKQCRYIRGYDPHAMRMPEGAITDFVFGNNEADNIPLISVQVKKKEPAEKAVVSETKTDDDKQKKQQKKTSVTKK